jgi:hypothetical protein
MAGIKTLCALVVMALLAVGPRAAARAEPDEPDPDEVPVVGRPNDLPFSEASGKFRASTRAEPTALEAGTPLTLTLTVRGVGTVRRPPQRLDLRKLPAFATAFHIEDLPDLPQPDPKTWEFAWRLKPRRADVTEVPGLPFVYFDPTIRPAERGFQVLYTDPIALQVRPQGSVAVALQTPARAFEVVTGPAVFARRQAWGAPGPLVVVLLLLAPPLACAAWYWSWRHRNPDAARLAHQRRSRAARVALHRLHGLGKLPPAEAAAGAAGAVAGYLRERLDLGAREPTPAEVRAHLDGHGCTGELATQAADFYRACDAVRFLPPSGAAQDLADEAARLILAVEAATCQPA